MQKILRQGVLALILSFSIWGCGDDDNESRITGPDLEKGPGRVFPIKSVSFPSIDGVPVGALFGQIEGSVQPSPVVILVHDFFLDNNEWLQTDFYIDLLERGYLPLAINLRGHGVPTQGNTPLPDGRTLLQLDDLENMHLDVQAALTWLRTQPAADVDRVAVVGSGLGGNVAYVSMGVFPQQIKTAVALSPGLWDNTLEPLVIGAGQIPFSPHSMLFLVGSDDIAITQAGEELNFPIFSNDLAAITANPKTLTVFDGIAAHASQLLLVQGVSDQIFNWLETHLQ